LTAADRGRDSTSAAAAPRREEKPMNGGRARELFRRFAHTTSHLVGTAWAFFAAVVVIVAWALTGPVFHFSDTWQLVINTGTTIVTFLMVFLIQNTQNRDAKAIHLKLDELIRAVEAARNRLVDLEDLSDDELAKLESEFRALREHEGSRTREGSPERAPLLHEETRRP
jgi:low affinity Fe/Cu permease